MKKLNLDKLWEKEKLPIVNGVLFPDGKLVNFLIQEGVKRKIKKVGETLIDLDSMLLASVDKIFELNLPGASAQIFCGEGSMGGDGFVCLKSKKTIRWVAFFENSNPFIKLSIDNKYIVAQNNLLEKWEFLIENPQKLNINILESDKY